MKMVVVSIGLHGTPELEILGFCETLIAKEFEMSFNRSNGINPNIIPEVDEHERLMGRTNARTSRRITRHVQQSTYSRKKPNYGCMEARFGGV